jgi:F0F1-type ATP synthase alpha subunit
VHGYLDPLPLERISAFEEVLLHALHHKHKDILEAIRTSGDLSDSVAVQLKAAVETVAKTFV